MKSWTGLKETDILNLSAAMCQMALTAKETRLAMENFAKMFNNFSEKEKYKKLKLNTLKNRLITLESRQTECNNIKKKIKRKIRYLETN